MLVRIFRHYVPISLVALGTIEALILFGAMYAGVAARFSGFELNASTAASIFPIYPKALIFTVVILGTMIALGLYQRDSQQSDWGYYVRCGVSFVVGLFVITLIFYAVPSVSVGRGVFAYTLIFAFIGHITTRFVFLKVVDYEALKRRILVLGTGSRAASVSILEKTNGGSERFRVVGYLPLNAVQHAVNASLILSESDSLQAIVDRYRIDEIVVGVRDRRHGDIPMNELLERKVAGTSVVDLLTFFERETGQLQLESLNPSWLIFSDGFRHGVFKSVIKRIFDISVSSVLVVITLPIMILTAMLIGLESRGPIFYRQERIGAGGHPFSLLKFRSMCVNAEPDGHPRWATESDARRTRVGKIIRRLRIDELPQLINVLRGEMSFVGPRPERDAFVKDLSKQVSYYSYRHTVKPGITGWAQVSYPYGSSVEDTKKKLQYDLYYVKNHSLFLDLIILLETAHIVLLGKGAR